MNKNQNVKTKAEVTERVWKRMKAVLDERGISQTALLRMCEAQGYKISQPELSRLFSGKLHLNLYQMIAFSDVLETAADRFINEDSIFRKLHVSGKSFITNPCDEAFSGYLGSYHTIFCSTSPFENNRVLRGKLDFCPVVRGDICEASFWLDTGEKDLRGNAIIKYYQGQLIISRKIGVAYCVLSNEQIGELNMIEFRHRNFLVKQAECRLGLVLTAAAGEKKNPVCQRMFLSRIRISDESLSKFIPFLKQESEEVWIRKQDLLLMKREEYPQLNIEDLLNKCESDEYILVDEKTLRKGRRLSRVEVAELFSAIKSISFNSFLASLEEEDDSRIYSLLSLLRDSENSKTMK